MILVWFKKDLRIVDHAPLDEAVKQGMILPIVIIEPDYWKKDYSSLRQYEFYIECINDLSSQFSKLGSHLIVKVGDSVDIISRLIKTYSITTMVSHQETGTLFTYERDKKILSWCKQHDVSWLECQQNGVVRALDDRDQWASYWDDIMTQNIITQPDSIQTCKESSDNIPLFTSLNSTQQILCPHRLKGGRTNALKILNDFLYHRSKLYRYEMSSPLTAFDSCSRLSPYITFGCLSIREIYQNSIHRLNQLKQEVSNDSRYWIKSIQSFISRLYWHCHFIQKLEDEPDLEDTNMHSLYDTLARTRVSTHLFKSWANGLTGFPMIDACMRSLHAHGWINFRMRAMLMSFASYQLWLDWKLTAPFLASLFVDFEPGIHYPQCQMQSGTTGMNTLRVYNPIKQGYDQDPTGQFIRHWIPELQSLPDSSIHEPWTMPLYPTSYPDPIIDEKKSRKYALDQIFALRKTTAHQKILSPILKKHASRKR